MQRSLAPGGRSSREILFAAPRRAMRAALHAETEPQRRRSSTRAGGLPCTPARNGLRIFPCALCPVPSSLPPLPAGLSSPPLSLRACVAVTRISCSRGNERTRLFAPRPAHDPPLAYAARKRSLVVMVRSVSATGSVQCSLASICHGSERKSCLCYLPPTAPCLPSSIGWASQIRTASLYTASTLSNAPGSSSGFLASTTNPASEPGVSEPTLRPGKI